MSGAPKKDQSTGELKTARTLNTVATIGAGHALYSMVPEKKREDIRNAGVKRLPQKVQPGTKKVLATLKEPKLGGKMTTAGKVVAGGWLGLHGAELAGDVMARRSINAQLDKKQSKVKSVSKNDMTMISKAKGDVSSNGRGKNLAKTKWCDDCGMPEAKCTCGHVKKAQRRFDPEADRQRRIGMYSAGGAAGAVYLGDKARTQLAREGMKVIRPKGKKGTLLGLGALASGTLGVGAYKRGVDVRNQPWT